MGFSLGNLKETFNSKVSTERRYQYVIISENVLDVELK